MISSHQFARGLTGPLLFAGSAFNFNFWYWQKNDFAPFMYNHVIGTDQTLTIVAVGVELYFDPTFRASPSAPAQPDQGIGTSTSA